jgi:hypothetical protein
MDLRPPATDRRQRCQQLTGGCSILDTGYFAILMRR